MSKVKLKYKQNKSYKVTHMFLIPIEVCPVVQFK